MFLMILPHFNKKIYTQPSSQHQNERVSNNRRNHRIEKCPKNRSIKGIGYNYHNEIVVNQTRRSLRVSPKNKRDEVVEGSS